MRNLDDRLRQQLRFEESGFGLLPPEASFASTDRHLQVWIKPRQGTSVSAPPQESYLDPALDIHVVAHQQVFDGFAEYRFAGRRIHDQQVLNTIEALRGSVPWSLWVHSRRPRWSIKLADTQPASVCLADGNMRILIRIAEFQYGPDVLSCPIQIEVTLRPEITAEGPRLHRIAGPIVMVDQNGDQAPSENDKRLAELLGQKFDGIFPPDAYFDRLQPPAGGSWDMVRNLALSRLDIHKEWIEIGFQFRPASTPAQMASVQ